MKDGSVITVQRYFEKTYNLKISQPKQPLLLCKDLLLVNLAL